MPERITSKTNAKVRGLRAALAMRDDGTVGIEGLHLVQEAIRSGLRIRTLYLREDKAEVLPVIDGDAVTETLVLSMDAFNSAAMTEHAQGFAALLDKPQATYLPRSGDLLMVADGLQDPGNLGTLIRSAEAFGAAAVCLGPNTVSPWNGKCLRAAAGAAFRIPLPRWHDGLRADLLSIDGRIFAAVAHGGRPAHTAALAGTCALVVGNEAAGLSAAMLHNADEHITLATPGPTESLNAAVAGSLLLYEAAQQRLRARQ